MHPEAFGYVAGVVAELGPWGRVVEFGGRDVNGSVRSLFGDATYCSIDLVGGAGVDVVGDAVEVPLAGWDVVVCCEVLEHAVEPERLVVAARGALRDGGVFVVTCAGPGRAPHGADGGGLRPGEHYRNVAPADLHGWLVGAGFSGVSMDVQGSDVRATARR